MSVYQGYGGALYLDATGGTPAKKLGIRNWRISSEVDKEDITMMGQGNAWRQLAPTLAGASCSFDAVCDSTDDYWAGAPPTVSVGNWIDVVLYLVDEGDNYSGTAVVDSVEAELAVDGLLTLSVNATFSAGVTYPT